MPTIATKDGFRVVIYPNDHEPEHVHVIGPDAAARFRLNCREGPVELIDQRGMRKKDIRAIGDFLMQIIGQLCAAWIEIHGEIKRKKRSV